MNKEVEYEYHEVSEKSFSLIDILSIIWKGKFLIILFAFLALTFSIIGAKLYNNNHNQLNTIISLQWKGITQGEYPDGQIFNSSNMFEAHVLNAALESTDITDITISELRKNLSINGIVPNDMAILIEQSIRNGQKMSYYPTEFKLTLKYSELGLDKYTGEVLLSSIINNFREDFEKTYIEQKILVEKTTNDIDAYDYSDMRDILIAQLSLIENSINRTLPESSKFVSSTNGLGFEDLLVIGERIEKTLIQDMIAGLETTTNIVSKNPELTKIRYENEIEILANQLVEQIAIKTELTTIIENYKGGEHVIIIPGTNNDYEYNTNPYLKTLYEKLVETEYNIARINTRIQLLETRIMKLSADVDTQETLYIERVQFIEDKVDQIKIALDSLINDTNTVLEDYNKFVINSSIRNITPSNLESPQNTILIGSIGLILGVMIGIATVIGKSYIKNNKNLKS